MGHLSLHQAQSGATYTCGTDSTPRRCVDGLLCCGAQARPQAATAIGDEHGEASDAADGEELANNNAIDQDEASGSDYKDADDTVDPRETDDAEVAAAIAAASHGDDAQDSSPVAAMDPAPAAVVDAPGAAGDGDIIGDTGADAAPAEQPAGVLASAPTLSPAMPGAWAVSRQSSHGGLPAAENCDSTGSSVLSESGLTPLPDAKLSLSGDRLPDDASCALPVASCQNAHPTVHSRTVWCAHVPFDALISLCLHCHQARQLVGVLESTLSACSHPCSQAGRCSVPTRYAQGKRRLRRPEQARDVFDGGVVSEGQFRDDGAAIVRSADLLCRVGGAVFRWRHAVPALAGRVAYPLMPWRRLFRRGIRACQGPADGSDSPSAPSQVSGLTDRPCQSTVVAVLQTTMMLLRLTILVRANSLRGECADAWPAYCSHLHQGARCAAGGFSWQELGLLAASMALATAPAGA